jgi:CRP-like cAMP-binding protein
MPPAHNNSGKSAYREFLKSISLFSSFDEDAISQLLNKSIVTEYKKDRLLFLTGDEAEFLYIIINGWVKLFRETSDGHESIFYVLTHGEAFGKIAMLKKSSFDYSAEIVADSVLMKIPASFMIEMAGDQEHFSDLLDKFLKSQISETNKRCLEAEHLTHMTSAQRVGCFLLKMCGHKKEGDITLQFPYEKSLIAGRLGMTPETFSRSLNQLGSLGVKIEGSKVTINNISQLHANICDHCSAMKKDCNFGEEEDGS